MLSCPLPYREGVSRQPPRSDSAEEGVAPTDHRNEPLPLQGPRRCGSNLYNPQVSKPANAIHRMDQTHRGGRTLRSRRAIASEPACLVDVRSEAVAPARLDGMPAELLLRLRVRRAAGLRHHLGAVLARTETSDDRRHAKRLIRAERLRVDRQPLCNRSEIGRA